jgi:hypothetical protein
MASSLSDQIEIVSFRLGLSRDCLAARGNVVLQLNCGTWHAARAHGGNAAAVSFLLFCKTMRREIAPSDF